MAILKSQYIVHQRITVCDFCGKKQNEVEFVIAGPDTHAICSECVVISIQIVIEKRAEKRKVKPELVIDEMMNTFKEHFHSVDEITTIQPTTRKHQS